MPRYYLVLETEFDDHKCVQRLVFTGDLEQCLLRYEMHSGLDSLMTQVRESIKYIDEKPQTSRLP